MSEPCGRRGAATRPTFVVRLRPKPVVDPLITALKILGRRFGLRAIEVREERLSLEASSIRIESLPPGLASGFTSSGK
jgi:hypothetical protein